MKHLQLMFALIAILSIASCKKDEPDDDANNTLPCAGEVTVTDIDGNIYNVVHIGNTCWMKENLNVSRYRNGDSIPHNLDNNQWANTQSGALAVYDENSPSNDAVYGKLYNSYTIADPRGLCPTGWHVPDDNDWKGLIKHIDGSTDTSSFSFVPGGPQSVTLSTIAGGMMKSTGNLSDGSGLWNYPNVNATNIHDFSGLPGGWRNYTGGFAELGEQGFFISSSSYVSFPNRRSVFRIYAQTEKVDWILLGIDNTDQAGTSVRCIRD